MGLEHEERALEENPLEAALAELERVKDLLRQESARLEKAVKENERLSKWLHISEEKRRPDFLAKEKAVAQRDGLLAALLQA